MLSLIYLQIADKPRWQLLAEITASLTSGRCARRLTFSCVWLVAAGGARLGRDWITYIVFKYKRPEAATVKL